MRLLGHDVIACETSPSEVARHTREHQPELALVGLGESNDHALALIDQIVHESACPVIVVVSGPHPDFVARAAILPLGLAFAAGAMVYVVLDELVPESHARGFERLATFGTVGGFAVMMALDTAFG